MNFVTTTILVEVVGALGNRNLIGLKKCDTALNFIKLFHVKITGLLSQAPSFGLYNGVVRARYCCKGNVRFEKVRQGGQKSGTMTIIYQSYRSMKASPLRNWVLTVWTKLN